ncbi:hypothetical protein J2Y03_002299 [Neobacillus niacini]|uniref:hypothetical protein n=1 Tax=Neobacillus niacini TaxID=86668 RepID=UPI0028672A48|nr:hypothetical protein [Neobacillus niacini]MDR7077275.1 hypothetical protein [Neobacillus niacini]
MTVQWFLMKCSRVEVNGLFPAGCKDKSKILLLPLSITNLSTNLITFIVDIWKKGQKGHGGSFKDVNNL